MFEIHIHWHNTWWSFLNKLQCKIPTKTRRKTRKFAKANDLIQLTLMKSFVIRFLLLCAMTSPVCLQLTRSPAFWYLTLRAAACWCLCKVFPYRLGLLILATLIPEPSRRARFSGKQGGEDSLASYRESKPQLASPHHFSLRSAFTSLRKRGKINTHAD